jgi:hypothetical protein
MQYHVGIGTVLILVTQLVRCRRGGRHDVDLPEVCGDDQILGVDQDGVPPLAAVRGIRDHDGRIVTAEPRAGQGRTDSGG